MSRVGGKEEVETERQIRSSGKFTTSLLFTNPLLSCITFPAKTTQLMGPPKVYISQYPCYYQPSTSPKTCGSSLSTTNPTSFPANRASQCLEHYQELFQNQCKTSRNATFTANSTPAYMINGLRAKNLSGQLRPNKIDTRNLPIIHQAAPNVRPAAYSPLLTPLPSVLCPHCLAHECLRLWKPLVSHINQQHANLPEEDTNRIFDIMANA